MQMVQNGEFGITYFVLKIGVLTNEKPTPEIVIQK